MNTKLLYKIRRYIFVIDNNNIFTVDYLDVLFHNLNYPRNTLYKPPYPQFFTFSFSIHLSTSLSLILCQGLFNALEHVSNHCKKGFPVGRLKVHIYLFQLKDTLHNVCYISCNIDSPFLSHTIHNNHIDIGFSIYCTYS